MYISAQETLTTVGRRQNNKGSENKKQCRDKNQKSLAKNTEIHKTLKLSFTGYRSC